MSYTLFSINTKCVWKISLLLHLNWIENFYFLFDWKRGYWKVFAVVLWFRHHPPVLWSYLISITWHFSTQINQFWTTTNNQSFLKISVFCRLQSLILQWSITFKLYCNRIFPCLNWDPMNLLFYSNIVNLIYWCY